MKLVTKWIYLNEIIVMIIMANKIVSQFDNMDNYDLEPAKIKQSNECTGEEIDKEIQCFQEIPKPLYEIPKDSTATLRCTVRNQNGKVQWKALSELLGYDRNIPGRSRFRVVGAVAKGEHFLEIRKVDVSDAGNYECQVQPVGQKHPLLRRSTTLVVLVNPTVPQIFFGSPNSMPSKNEITINSVKSETRSYFTCVSFKGRPKTTFKWFLNNIELKNQAGSALIEAKDNDTYVLSYMTNKLKDGDVIRCRVFNRATEIHHDPARQHFDAEVVILIQTSPGQPEIVEPSQTQGVPYAEGDVISATCISSPPGKPEGSILWKWRFPESRELYNNRIENFTYKDISPQYSQQMISRNQIISKLQLPPMTRKYHGAQLICAAVNPIVSLFSTALNISVKYPPSEVVISTADNSLIKQKITNDGITELVIFGRSGEEKTITCTTAHYFSEAMIKWDIQYSPLVDDNFVKKISFVPIEKVWREGASFRRNSTIKITIDKQLDKSFVECQAWSDGKRVDAKAKLDITYPPETPTISGYNIDIPVKMSHVIDLICSTVGGNPYPDLQWFKGNQALQSTFPVQQIGNQKSLKIRITPSKSDNNIKYFCQAKSVALKDQPLKSKEFSLKVLFPPNELNLKFLNGPVVESGEQLALECLAGESNPAAFVRWKINRCGQLMSELGRRQIKKTCDEEILPGESTEVLNGKFGGAAVRSTFQITTKWTDHLDYIDCEIFNPDYGEDRQVLRKRLQMNITFKPQFEGIISNNFIIQEGQSEVFNLEPISNPTANLFKWFRDDKEIRRGSTVVGNNAKLIITKVTSSDIGNYTLIASNNKGESSIRIFLNVTYGPKIIGGKKETVKSSLQNENLECLVNANPADPYQSFRWVRRVPRKGPDDISPSDFVDGFNIGCNQAEWKSPQEKTPFKFFSKCSRKSQFEMISILVIYDVDRNDVGVYHCLVNNGVGPTIKKEVELIKDFTPQILSVPQHLKSAAELGGSATLLCFIRAEPEPQVIWYNGRNNQTIKSSSKHVRNKSRYRPGFYVDSLTIKNLQRQDHGRYICEARNYKGSHTAAVDVSGTSIPDVPLEIQLINKTQSSITISWMQGFDGGSLQTFQVRWKDESRHLLYQYEDVASDSVRTRLEFTVYNLKSNTLYYISVNSRNSQHGQSAFTEPLKVLTVQSFKRDEDQDGEQPVPSHSRLQDNTILFIVAATVFGFVILVVNILVIVFVLRRRRQRTRTEKLESRYNNPKDLLAATNGLILSREDHLRDSNSNFLRSEALELYPRAMDTSLLSQHSHQAHSLRRSIPDDQKTFSSFDTGSDDAREDLLRRQREFACCGVDSNVQKGSFVLAYDPITNSSYYAPVAATSSTPVYLQPGGQNAQMMAFVNMVPISGQRTSSCGSVNSGQFNLINVNRQPSQIVGNSNNSNNNVSPCGSALVLDPNNPNSVDQQDLSQMSLNGPINNISITNANINNQTPYRSRVISPTFMNYSISPQQRDLYANELRKAQLSGNLLINPAVFSRQSSTSPHHIMNPAPLISPQIINSSGATLPMPLSFENMSVTSGTLNRPGSVKSSDSRHNSVVVTTTLDGKVSQKYRCSDSQNHINKGVSTIDNPIEFVNSAMDDSLHQDKVQDSQFLPRPTRI